MCGFIGEFSFQESDLLSTSAFSDILALSKHRGPDATEIKRGQNFQLGFNRLSILDLSPNGNQPKQSPSGRYHVVFNGEIYNYKSLAETYQLKNLQSSSDTEVIIHLLDVIGIKKTITLLNGMFAIAIVDTEKNTFNLTRDFSGIKPLFYGVTDKGVAVASQFDQVYKHPWLKSNLQLRPSIMKEYFGFGYMQAPNTVYQSIFQVNPGEWIVIKKDKTIKKQQLISFDKVAGNQKIEDNQTATSYNELLGNVVKRQLISDVPIATFLSGGVDSPLISAHAKSNKNDVEAITLKVDDETLNESEIATSYAEALGLKQDVFEIKASEILESIDAYFEKCSEPFGDYSSLPTFLLTQHAAKNYKVMLSGDGGDELFMGYPRFRQFMAHYYLYKLPFGLRKPLVRLLNKTKISKVSAPFYYKTIGDWQMAKHLHIFPNILDDMFPGVDYSTEIKALYNFKEVTNKQTLLHSLKHNEFYAHLQRVLIKVDRSSMANSLEVRVPFLDKESIDFSWKTASSLPKHKILKKTLKDCLGQYVPKTLINKTKMGFMVPLDDWLKNQLKEDVLYHVFEIPFYGAEFLDENRIKGAVKDYYEKGLFSAWGIWHIYAWQKWAVKHVYK
ncbi:asparagine synthase (glutamine-hydrolyzing) [uncultured Winogradskyella sp.]|uniref:asparagine synthase (glutamine-hydrolyzing) n=1 Tax=Winogradskyella sp. 4-2091 TaxID=3381659 RepID=UPI002624F00A|nr:asparagine synthase (glutamine-hydrolyzing) [uncultured Winogradskyella sp.]